MFSNLFGMAVYSGLAFALINALMGSMNASLLSFGRTVSTTLTFTSVFIVLLAFEMTLLDSGNFVQFFECFGIMFGLSLLSMPFVIFRAFRHASSELAEKRKASAFALDNFDRLAEGSNEAQVITYASLSMPLLDPAFTEADRKMINYLRDNLNDFGHKSCKTSDFAASRSDVQIWPIKYADRRQTWLRSGK
jgi:hypothetical protein